MPTRNLDEIIDACRVPNAAPARGAEVPNDAPHGPTRPLRPSDLPARAGADLRPGDELVIDAAGVVWPVDMGSEPTAEGAECPAGGMIARAGEVLRAPNAASGAECRYCGGDRGFHAPGCSENVPDAVPDAARVERDERPSRTCSCPAAGGRVHSPNLCAAPRFDYT